MNPLAKLLKSWFGIGKKSPIKRRSRECRLAVETLEDRTVPTLAASVNSTLPTKDGFVWLASEAGWIYRPSMTITVNAITTRFDSLNGNTITAGIWDAHAFHQEGLTLLRSTSFTPDAPDLFFGGTFTPISLSAGGTYLIGFQNLVGMGVNTTNAAGSTDLGTTHCGSTNNGWFDSFNDPNAGDPIFQLLNNSLPVASIGSPLTANEGSVINVSGSSSSDSDFFGFVTRYEWDLNYTGTFTLDSTSLNPAVSLTDGPGTRTVALRVRDNVGGLSSTVTKTITVQNVAPTIAISGASSVNEGSPYSLTLGAVTDPGVDTVSSYIVHWGDGSPNSTFTSAGVKTHVYDGPGTYAITVDLVDGDGTHLNRANARSVTVSNIAPVVTAPAAQNATEGTSASFALGSFTDPGADAPWQVTVNWGDGSANTVFTVSSPGALPPRSHTYADDGQYTVTVTVREENGTGASGFASFFVNPSNVVPIVTAPAAQTADAGTSTSFDLGSFSDVGADSPWQITVNWGDGSADTVFTVNTPGPLPPQVHTYTDAGEYAVTVTVREDNGAGMFGVAGFRVSAISVVPTVTAPGTQDADEGTSTSFDIGSFTDASGAEHWQVAVNWGDGSADTVFAVITQGALPPQEHTYADDGQYTVTVTVTVRGETGPGAFGVAQFLVNTHNVRPVVFVPGIQIADEGVSTSFALGSFTDPGADSPWQVTVNWGDGSADTVFTMNSPGAIPNQNHTFADHGARNVTVSVRDKNGGASHPVIFVIVGNIAPTLTISGDGSVDEGSLYTLSLASTDPGADTIDHWTINWGDGNIETVSGNPSSITHTYADGDNSYTISATATDEDGTFDANTISVSVHNVAPTLTISGDASVDEGWLYTLNLASSDPGADTIDHWIINWGDGHIEIVSGNPSSATHTYADGDNSYTISATAADEDGTFAATAFGVRVNNVVPEVAAPADETKAAQEGASTSFDLGRFTDPGADGPWQVAVNWGDGSADTVFAVNTPGALPPQDHTYADDGSYTVTVTVREGGGAAFGAGAFQVDVSNVRPSLSVGGAASVHEGELYTLTLASEDPGADTIDYWTINWGDGNIETVSGGSATHVYRDDDPTATPMDLYSIKVAATDEDGVYNYMGKLVVEVINVAPAATLDPVNDINENGVATLTGAITDPGTLESFTLELNWGDALSPNNSQSFSLGATALTRANDGIDWNPLSRHFVVDHQYLDDNPTGTDQDTYTISAAVIDDDMTAAASEVTTSVTVDNVAPAFEAGSDELLNAPQAGVFSRGPISFTDPGADVWSGTVNFGDGATDIPLHVDQLAKTFSLSHTYATAGTYTVIVTLQDDDGNPVIDTFQVEVILNTPPVALASSVTTDEDTAKTFAGSDFNFTDAQGHGLSSITISSLSLASGDTLRLSGADVMVGQTIVAANIPNLVYTPAGDAAGAARSSFDFYANDADLGTLAATMTINVTSINDAAVLSADTRNLTETDAAADISSNGRLTISDVDSPATFVAQAETVGVHGAFTLAVDGAWTYTASSAHNEFMAGVTYTDTFTATSADGTTTTVTINILGANDAPVLAALTNSSPDCCGAMQGQAISIAGSFSDLDANDIHTVTINWGDGTANTVIADLATAITTFSANHVYASGGIYTISATVTDNHTGISNTRTTTSTIGGVGLLNGQLQIIGTAGRDIVNVTKHGSIYRVDARLDAQWRDHDDDHDWNDDHDNDRHDDDDDDRHKFSTRHQHYTFNAANVSSILIIGCDGNDQLRVGHSVTVPATIDGGMGNDRIWSGGGNDLIIDLFGSNRIHAGQGNDTVTTGAGDDRIWTDGGNDTINAGNGNNRVYSGGGNDVILTGSGNDYVWSDGGADHINVGDGNNDVHAGGGNNIIIAGSGDDDIWSRDGNDSINAGDGNNDIHAGDGDDNIVTGSGNDRIWSDGGNDNINAGDGDNDVRSGAGNDIITTGAGRDTIDAGNGNDLVKAGGGADSIQGGAGDDILLGEAGDDLLMGGDDRDLIIGGIGADRLVGNQSDDILIAGTTSFDGNDAALRALMSEWASSNSYTTRINNLTNGGGANGTTRLVGDDGAAQTVFNDSSVDTLTGSQGADWLFANRVADNGGPLDNLTDKAANELWNDTDF